MVAKQTLMVETGITGEARVEKEAKEDIQSKYMLKLYGIRIYHHFQEDSCILNILQKLYKKIIQVIYLCYKTD